MKYADKQLRRLLAAEYALGTLRGPARRRFERLAQGDAGLRAELRFWETRLATLARALPPVPPPPTAWISLQKRMASGNTVPIRREAPKPVPLWRIAAGIAAALVVVTVVMLSQKPSAPNVAATQAGPTYVAQLKLSESSMQWTVRLNPAKGEMTAAASGEYPQLGSHSLELWCILPHAAPMPLGLLPMHGQNRMPMPKELAGVSDMTLAVSLEPVGGSPTGAPTGPVLTSAPAALSS